VKIHHLGILGRLEAARQALEEAGSDGLSIDQLAEACGLEEKWTPVSGWASVRGNLLPQLTRYCGIYEEGVVVRGSKRRQTRYYLNEEIDLDFKRRLLPYDFTGEKSGNSDWELEWELRAFEDDEECEDPPFD
jgi:hypothetical protein